MMNENTTTRTLVTGGSGFVGTALCTELIAAGVALRVLQRAPVATPAFAAGERVERVVGDLLDPQSLLEACQGINVVVHLAGIAHVSVGQDAAAQQIIVEGTRNLLAAAIVNKVRRLVYVSSSLAQAAGDNRGDVTVYGRHKQAAEKLLLEADARGAIEVVIVRPVNIYGPGMKGNIATMISLVRRNRLPPLPALATRLSLVSVGDVVQALKLAIVHQQAIGKVYLVTDGQEYQIEALEKAIYAALGKQFPRWRTPRVVLFAAACLAEFGRFAGINSSAIGLRTYRNLTTDNVFDSTAISRELGFKPGTTFYQELPQIIAKILLDNSRQNFRDLS